MTDTAAQEPASRAERKERTRQALLDGALELLADRSFASLSLREVTRSVGIVPTAFYRHFPSLEDLGVALVEDSMRMLREMLRDARRDPHSKSTAASLEILDRQVQAHTAQFRFISRERHGGVAEIRRAISGELALFASELTIDLSRLPGLAEWEADDLAMAANLLVTAMLETVAALLDVHQTGRGRDVVLDRAERQLRLIVLGMAQWRPADG
ncbi:TetR family transcriptional regulator [Tomitella biformata]|uniref:TetR family transcriptional regulator n=1 Tax=Tomitella biformata TaxID=630403 RepID=UPI000465379F|nr:TetR family transcriptional regulator [Tomitella biformata]